jgi:hypothetical protein
VFNLETQQNVIGARETDARRVWQMVTVIPIVSPDTIGSIPTMLS